MRIRVLYIDEISRIAGVEAWYLSFISGLQCDEIEPFLLCPKGPFAEAARVKGVKVINFKFYFQDVAKQKYWRYILFLIFKISDAVRTLYIVNKYNISIIHSVNTNGHVITGFIRKLFKIPVIWHVHQMNHPYLYRLFKPDYIVFVAKYRQNILKELKLEKKRKYKVLYNGIDTTVYSAINSFNHKQFTIGYAARLKPEKGIEVLLDSAVLLLKKYPQLRFDIYGEEIYDEVYKGKYTDYIKNKIGEMNLEKSVILGGFIFPQNKIYSSIDLYVLPSYALAESCPMVILEAWAAGVPVVASDVGGIPELITHGETGWLVPIKNPQALADTISYVIGHPEEAKRVVENARKLVREKFDHRENAQRFVELYKEMLHERS